MSEVTRRQQMNPVVGVAEAMMERRRRQRSSFLRLSRQNLMRRIGGERSHAGAWVERREASCGKTSLRERATERERGENEVDRKKSLMCNMKRRGRGRHKAQSEVAFYGVA